MPTQVLYGERVLVLAKRGRLDADRGPGPAVAARRARLPGLGARRGSSGRRRPRSRSSSPCGRRQARERHRGRASAPTCPGRRGAGRRRHAALPRTRADLVRSGRAVPRPALPLGRALGLGLRLLRARPGPCIARTGSRSRATPTPSSPPAAPVPLSALLTRRPALLRAPGRRARRDVRRPRADDRVAELAQRGAARPGADERLPRRPALLLMRSPFAGRRSAIGQTCAMSDSGRRRRPLQRDVAADRVARGRRPDGRLRARLGLPLGGRAGVQARESSAQRLAALPRLLARRAGPSRRCTTRERCFQLCEQIRTRRLGPRVRLRGARARERRRRRPGRRPAVRRARARGRDPRGRRPRAARGRPRDDSRTGRSRNCRSSSNGPITASRIPFEPITSCATRWMSSAVTASSPASSSSGSTAWPSSTSRRRPKRISPFGLSVCSTKRPLASARAFSSSSAGTRFVGQLAELARRSR